MSRALRRLATLAALAATVTACQIVLWSWPAGVPVPDVAGPWQGAWTIAPPLSMRILVTEQDATRITGVATYLYPSGAVSMGLRGEFGVRDGRRVLLLTVAGLDRTDDFELTTLEEDRLEGRGVGRGLGGQRGRVTLRRQ